MKYDAVVIGSGQGGNPLCHGLADQGWKVALVERAHLGGTCINTGCTPTKTMVASAQVAHYVRNAARWGIHSDNLRVDLPAVVARKNTIVQQFRAGQERRVSDRQDRLDLYRGHARFSAAKRIRIDGQELESEHVFINTGTRPEIPRIEGIDDSHYLTNATVMELLEVPDHLVVLGGGYIGLEFGQMFRRFGSRVTVIHQSGQLLPREDADVVGELQQALEAEGIAFRLNARTTRITGRGGQSVRLSIDTPAGADTVEGSHLLVAAGRRPNTDDLGARGYRLKIGKIAMSSVARAIERDESTGLMKIVVDAETDRILGASILATEGGELVQILGAVMMADAPYTVLKGAVYIHPTLAEGFWTLMERVQPVDGAAPAGPRAPAG